MGKFKDDMTKAVIGSNVDTKLWSKVMWHTNDIQNKIPFVTTDNTPSLTVYKGVW